MFWWGCKMRKIILILISTIVLIGMVAGAGTTVIFSPAADGAVLRVAANQTFAQIIPPNAGTSTSSTNKLIDLETATGTETNKFSTNCHGIWSFDTSSIPDDANILSASLQIMPAEAPTVTLGNWWIVLKNGSLITNTTYATNDYVKNGSTEISARIPNSSFSSGVNYTIPLNAAGLTWISKTSYTVIESQSAWESDASYTGSWAANSKAKLSIYSKGDTAGRRPFLTVVYDIPPVASFNIQLIDTSTGPASQWEWNATNLLAANPTTTTISTDQNPVVSLGQGNWLISLNATNSINSNITTQRIGLLLNSPQVYWWNRTA
jgi:hypothetical protein